MKPKIMRELRWVVLALPYPIDFLLYNDLKTKVVSLFSLVIGQNASRQLATSSENLVTSALMPPSTLYNSWGPLRLGVHTVCP